MLKKVDCVRNRTHLGSINVLDPQGAAAARAAWKCERNVCDCFHNTLQKWEFFLG